MKEIILGRHVRTEKKRKERAEEKVARHRKKRRGRKEKKGKKRKAWRGAAGGEVALSQKKVQHDKSKKEKGEMLRVIQKANQKKETKKPKKKEYKSKGK